MSQGTFSDFFAVFREVPQGVGNCRVACCLVAAITAAQLRTAFNHSGSRATRRPGQSRPKQPTANRQQPNCQTAGPKAGPCDGKTCWVFVISAQECSPMATCRDFQGCSGLQGGFRGIWGPKTLSSRRGTFVWDRWSWLFGLLECDMAMVVPASSIASFCDEECVFLFLCSWLK